jgi:putative transposase
MDAYVCERLAASLDAARAIHAFDLWAYVFMPDHVHLLIRPRADAYSIAAILHSIKGPFAKWLLDEWKTRHPDRLRRLKVISGSRPTCRVWQRGGGFDRNLFSHELIRRAIDYIEFNPVRKGLVENPEGWAWSSAGARADKPNAALRIQEVNWECQPDG